jgi:hypothetical protein
MADICVRAKQIVGISFSSIQRFSNLLILNLVFLESRQLQILHAQLNRLKIQEMWSSNQYYLLQPMTKMSYSSLIYKVIGVYLHQLFLQLISLWAKVMNFSK